MRKSLSRALILVGSLGAIAVAGGTYLVFAQLNPALPPSLAELGNTRLTTARGMPVKLAQAVSPNAAAVVAFWATWCIPCRSEASALAILRRKYPASALSIAYLNVDEHPDHAMTAKFLRATHAENLPVLYADPAAWAAITGQRTMILPRAYVFDRSGRAVAAFAGAGKNGSIQDLEDSVAKAVR